MQIKNLIIRSVFIVTAITLFLLSSCKKNTEPEVLKSKIKSITSSQNEYISFEYNADGSVRKARLNDESVTGGGEVNYTISYNSAGQITQVISDNDEKIIPVYQNGVIVKAFLKTDMDEDLGFTEYSYQENKLKTISFYTKVGDIILPLTEMKLTYNTAGNIAQISLYVQNPAAPNSLLLSGTIQYEYDSKTNPLYFAKDFLQLLWYPVSKNNVVKEMHKNDNGNLEETTEYTYHYTPDMPDKAVVKTTTPGQEPFVSNLEFVYQ